MTRRKPAPLARRELTRAHLAFYRAVIEGVDLRRAWDQYLLAEGDFNDAAASHTMAWLRQALITEAMRAGEPALIGLFRRDPRRVSGGALPTLEQFAARFDDAGEFSEAELLAMWQEEFGRTPPEERRARLSRRLREALQLLERSPHRVPQPDDPVAQWLAPGVAARLSRAGIARLCDLQAALANRRRQRWGAVPRIGPVWSDRLADWLRECGLSAPPAADLASAPRLLEPIEALADDDPDARAVRAWLARPGLGPHTLRSYRKAAERLLLWCRHERRTSLLSMTVEDGIHYRQWLKTIGGLPPDEWTARGWRVPQEAWMGGKGVERSASGWRPFALGATAMRDRSAGQDRQSPSPLLSAASVEQDIAALRALFHWLRDAGFAAIDPWSGRRPVAAPATAVAERSFTAAEWRELVATAEAGSGERPARLAVVLWLGFACGLRAAEMLSLTVGSLDMHGDDWHLQVVGRGGRLRRLPLPSPARAALSRYLAALGLAPDRLSSLPSSVPLLRGGRGRRRRDGSRPPEAALGYATLHGELKRHFLQCAAHAASRGDEDAAVRLRRASAHWLRHSCAVRGLESGALDLAAVRAVLGHAAAASTMVYAASSADRLGQQLELLAAGGGTVPPP